jgi:hypothetical protein
MCDIIGAKYESLLDITIQEAKDERGKSKSL